MAIAVGTCLCKRAVDAPSVFVDANIRFLNEKGPQLQLPTTTTRHRPDVGSHNTASDDRRETLQNLTLAGKGT